MALNTTNFSKENQVIIDILVNNDKLAQGIADARKRLDELKMAKLKLKGAFDTGLINAEQFDKEAAVLDAAIKDVNDSIRNYKREMDETIKSDEAKGESLNAMRARLKIMRREYEDMTADIRNSDEGLKKLTGIQKLTEEILDIEKAEKDFRRQVGNYEIAGEAMAKASKTSKQALKEMKEEIVQLTMSLQKSKSAIDAQTAEVERLKNTVGEGSDEYKDAKQKLDDMTSAYNNSVQALDDMEKKAGELSDTIGDVNSRIAANASDEAVWEAAQQGVTALTSSYMLLQAATTELGGDTESLAKIYAKLMLVQQGVNAVMAIAKALNKDSRLSVVLHNALSAKRNKIEKEHIANLSTENAETAKNTAETLENAAATTTAAAAEGVATKASFSLSTAIKGIGTAIKSIPVLGWILAAVSALGTAVSLVVKHNRELKKASEEEKKMANNALRVADAHKEAYSSMIQEELKLRENVRRLKEAQTGTDEWKRLTSEVASQLGVTEGWLRKNVEKVDDLTEAWVNMKIALADADAFSKEMAENNVKAFQLQADIEKVLTDAQKKDKDKIEAIKDEYEITYAMAKKIVDLWNKNQKKNSTSKDLVNYFNAINDVQAQLKKRNKAFEDEIRNAYAAASKEQDNFNKLAKDGLAETSETIKDKSKKTTEEIAEDAEAKARKLREKLEDMFVEGLAEGLEKEIETIEIATDRWVTEMEKARDKDLENEDTYNALILKKQEQTYRKITKIRENAFKSIMSESEAITNSYMKIWKTNTPNSFHNFLIDLKLAAEETKQEVTSLNDKIESTKRLIEGYKSTRDDADEAIDDLMDRIVSLKERIQKDINSQQKPITLPIVPVLSEDIDKIVAKYSQQTSRYSNVNTGLFDLDNNIVYADLSRIVGEYRNNVINAANSGGDISAAIDSIIVGYINRMGYQASNDSSFKSSVDKVKNALYNMAVEIQGAIANYGAKRDEYLTTVATNTGINEANRNLNEDRYNSEQAIADANRAIKEYKDGIADLDEKEVKANEILKSLESQRLANTEREYLTQLKQDKLLQDYAKGVHSVLLEEAKEGQLNVIPDNFSVFIDYQIDLLKERIVKLKAELENAAISGSLDEDSETIRDIRSQIEEYSIALERQLSLKKSLAEADTVEMQVTKELAASRKGFVSSELIEAETNLRRTQNQIDAVRRVIEAAKPITDSISESEAKNNEAFERRIELLNEIALLTKQIAETEDEATKKEIQANVDKRNAELKGMDDMIAANTEFINSLKSQLAAMGFTTEEEMTKVLNSLGIQLAQFQKNSNTATKNVTSSVLQSVNQMTTAFSDLIQTIGQDNEELNGFLMAVSFAQIGTNLAVGISEAVAAGAGKPWPENLAAIASGVAAVLAAMSSAFSAYQQYSKTPAFAKGGFVSGQGTSTSDSIPAWLSDGEYVVSAKKVKKYRPLIDLIEADKPTSRNRYINRYATGGYVSDTARVVNESMRDENMLDMFTKALTYLPNPVVSVMDIREMDHKVSVKEFNSMK